jgi:iron uptake system component EfeO
MHRSLRLTALAAMLVTGAACTSNDADSGGGTGGTTVQVSSTADECTLSATTAPSGNVVFEVTNDGNEATEFYLLREDGVGIVGEVENIGPGITRNLVVTVEPGSYVSACKPGQTGDGIRGDFTVTDSGTAVSVDSSSAAQLEQAVTRYAEYVRTEAAQLQEQTAAFAALYTSGDDDGARDLYPDARTHWERIEPVAESFGDLDPKLDLREADLEAGQAWTGWHRIEKDLWPPADGDYTAATDAERQQLADQLVADTAELIERVSTLEYQPAQLGNGAKELLDEIATGKVTGEEEIWSGTDLWDFQANIDGAHEAFESLEPVVAAKDPDLVTAIDEGFAAVQALLDGHRVGDGFVSYGELSADEVKALADAVNALSEPLSKLTAAVVL